MVLSGDDLELLEEELDMIDEAIFEAQEEVKKRHFEEVNLFKKSLFRKLKSINSPRCPPLPPLLLR